MSKKRKGKVRAGIPGKRRRGRQIKNYHASRGGIRL